MQFMSQSYLRTIWYVDINLQISFVHTRREPLSFITEGPKRVVLKGKRTICLTMDDSSVLTNGDWPTAFFTVHNYC